MILAVVWMGFSVWKSGSLCIRMRVVSKPKTNYSVKNALLDPQNTNSPQISTQFLTMPSFLFLSFSIPPLIQTDTHRHHERHIHPLRHLDHISLLIREQFPRSQRFAINPCNRQPSLHMHDICMCIEEIALHQQLFWLLREGIDEAADGFGTADCV